MQPTPDSETEERETHTHTLSLDPEFGYMCAPSLASKDTRLRRVCSQIKEEKEEKEKEGEKEEIFNRIYIPVSYTHLRAHETV